MERKKVLGFWDLFLFAFCAIFGVEAIATAAAIGPNGEIYAPGKWVVFYIGLSKLFDMATGVNQEIVGTSKYYKIDLLFYIFLAVIAVITNLIFIPKFGITGAAMASAISIFLFNTIRFFFLLYVFRIQPFSLSTLKVLAVFVLTFLISSMPLSVGIMISVIKRSIWFS